jgi:hypothetical protein
MVQSNAHPIVKNNTSPTDKEAVLDAPDVGLAIEKTLLNEMSEELKQFVSLTGICAATVWGSAKTMSTHCEGGVVSLILIALSLLLSSEI